MHTTLSQKHTKVFNWTFSAYQSAIKDLRESIKVEIGY